MTKLHGTEIDRASLMRRVGRLDDEGKWGRNNSALLSPTERPAGRMHPAGCTLEISGPVGAEMIHGNHNDDGRGRTFGSPDAEGPRNRGNVVSVWRSGKPCTCSLTTGTPSSGSSNPCTKKSARACLYGPRPPGPESYPN
jgi:hypothetical protein